MHNILIAGGGKIGTTIAHLLARTNQYNVTLADCNLDYIRAHFEESLPTNLELVESDINDHGTLTKLVQSQHIQSLMSCLPYFCNKAVAQFTHDNKLNYFDLTEDRDTAAFIATLAKNSKQSYAPQCGLAPGFINIIANDLMNEFSSIEDVKLRCGALPVNASNALQYSLTWSPDGLINEYGNPCNAIENGKEVVLSPLENLEKIQIDGLNYEAFNTSGGIGSLTETYLGKVNSLNYKSIRYPGHCEKIRFLMQGLKLNYDRSTLKKILLNALPYTTEDVVIIYVSVNGDQKGELIKTSYVNKFYPSTIDDIKYSAIQMTTASSACASIHLITQNSEKYHGRIFQEQFSLHDIVSTPFGNYLKVKSA